ASLAAFSSPPTLAFSGRFPLAPRRSIRLRRRAQNIYTAVWNLGSPATAMAQIAGKCVFCGGTGLTKGHVWPDWISKTLPVTASHHELVVGKWETFTSTLPGPQYSIKQRQGSARQRKPRNTCKACNGGWMSLIERAAMTSMTLLIHGVDVP